MTGFIRTHYYEEMGDQYAVCGADDGRATSNHDDVTCEDCKYEIR